MRAGRCSRGPPIFPIAEIHFPKPGFGLNFLSFCRCASPAPLPPPSSSPPCSIRARVFSTRNVRHLADAQLSAFPSRESSSLRSLSRSFREQSNWPLAVVCVDRAGKVGSIRRVRPRETSCRRSFQLERKFLGVGTDRLREISSRSSESLPNPQNDAILPSVQFRPRSRPRSIDFTSPSNPSVIRDRNSAVRGVSRCVDHHVCAPITASHARLSKRKRERERVIGEQPLICH